MVIFINSLTTKIDEVIANLIKESQYLINNIPNISDEKELSKQNNQILITELALVWCKKAKEKISKKQDLENSIKNFAEILNNSKYNLAVMMGEIAYQSNLLSNLLLEDEKTSEKLDLLIKIDINKLYFSDKEVNKIKTNQEFFSSKLKQISKESAIDAAKYIKELVSDLQFTKQEMISNYQINRQYTEKEYYYIENIREEYEITKKVFTKISKILLT